MANTRTYTRTLGAIIRMADPDFNRDRRKVLAYEFSNDRNFYEDPNNSGIYSFSGRITEDGGFRVTEDDSDREID